MSLIAGIVFAIIVIYFPPDYIPPPNTELDNTYYSGKQPIGGYLVSNKKVYENIQTDEQYSKNSLLINESLRAEFDTIVDNIKIDLTLTNPKLTYTTPKGKSGNYIYITADAYSRSGDSLVEGVCEDLIPYEDEGYATIVMKGVNSKDVNRYTVSIAYVYNSGMINRPYNTSIRYSYDIDVHDPKNASIIKEELTTLYNSPHKGKFDATGMLSN